ncbi:MAG: N-formylglutamate amidohydrolase [Micrococcales bacterium]|nr:N-formylglutamate amidohydrolase [Micrococcales bacterium]
MTENHREQASPDAPVDLLRHIHVEDRSDASSVILHVPHAGQFIPDELRASFVVAEPAILAELNALTDAATDRIAGAASTASIVRSGLSRLVVDVERFPDETEEMNAVGMGVLYTHGSRRQEIRRPTDRDRSVVAEYLHAYASRFADLVDRVLARHGSATIIDVHSFPTAALPYELHGELRRPELCIGTDPDHTPRSLVRMVRDAFAGLERPRRGVRT